MPGTGTDETWLNRANVEKAYDVMEYISTHWIHWLIAVRYSVLSAYHTISNATKNNSISHLDITVTCWNNLIWYSKKAHDNPVLGQYMGYTQSRPWSLISTAGKGNENIPKKWEKWKILCEQGLNVSISRLPTCVTASNRNLRTSSAV